MGWGTSHIPLNWFAGLCRVKLKKSQNKNTESKITDIDYESRICDFYHVKNRLTKFLITEKTAFNKVIQYVVDCDKLSSRSRKGQFLSRKIVRK